MIDTKELRRLVQAATPGPWINHGRQPNVAGLPHSAVAAKTLLARVYSEAYGDVEQETANASFIAAANPATISELLDRLEAAEKERDDVAQQLVQSEQGKRKISEECDELLEKLASANRAVEEAYQRGYATGQEEIEAERDALRAKVESMEQQKPVAEMVDDDFGKQIKGINYWWQLPNGAKLYTLPGAKGE